MYLYFNIRHSEITDNSNVFTSICSYKNVSKNIILLLLITEIRNNLNTHKYRSRNREVDDIDKMR